MTTETKNGLNVWAWGLAGIPAVIGWLVYFCAWLLVARFPEIGDPLDAAFLVMGWYYAIVIGLVCLFLLIAAGGLWSI